MMPLMAKATDPEHDDAFARLIQDEFGVTVSQQGVSEDAAHSRLAHPSARAGLRRETKPRTPDKTAEWFSLDRAIEQTEPDVEPFVPPTPPPLNWPRRPLVWIGLAFLLAAVGVGVAWAFSAPLPVWLRWAGGLAVGAGLACLLFSLPRHKDDPLDDGAVV